MKRINKVYDPEGFDLEGRAYASESATEFGYAIVFAAYECMSFHYRILTCQVWAGDIQDIVVYLSVSNTKNIFGHFGHHLGIVPSGSMSVFGLGDR